MKNTTTQTRLFNGLPAIWTGDDWLILSASCENIIHLTAEQIDDDEILRDLRVQNFFTVPTRKNSNAFHLTLITTGKCNLKCGYCFANGGESSLVMNDELAKAAVDTVISRANGRILSLAFFGGEPSLTPGLISNTVHYAKTMASTVLPGVEFSITTNGVVRPDFLRFLIDNRFLMTVSVDGFSEIQNDQRPLLSGNGSSEIVEETLRALVASGCEYKVRATVTEKSVHHLAKIVEWLHALGGTQIHFEVISIAGRALSTKGLAYHRPPVDVFAENLKRAIERGSALGVGVMNSSYMNLVRPPTAFCDGDTNHRFAVSPDGNITTCVEVQDRCHPAAQQFIVGKFEDGVAVFSNQCRQRMCHSIQPMKTNPECPNCFARHICAGGCPVRNFHTQGDAGVVDAYRCTLIRDMVPYIYRSIDDATSKNLRRVHDEKNPNL